MRLAVARHDGLDETTVAKVDHWRTSDLAEAHKAAIELAEWLMTQPGQIPDDLVARLRAHFSDAQLVELTVDVMKWNYQKVTVALGTDDEVRPGELVDLVFDDQGHWVRPG